MPRLSQMCGKTGYGRARNIRSIPLSKNIYGLLPHRTLLPPPLII